MSNGKPTEKWLKHLKSREGYTQKTYSDTLGYLTGGVGHLLTEAEQKMYPKGSKVTGSVIDEWLGEDSSKAYNAAINQASELKYQSQSMVEALASVNFQLGTGWRRKFPSAWKALKSGNYDEAIDQVIYQNPKNKSKKSAWSTQTPTRVNDFVNAIKELKVEAESVSVAALEASKKKGSDQERAENAVFKEDAEATQGIDDSAKKLDEFYYAKADSEKR